MSSENFLPSFEPWSNFFSSAYDRVKGCDCETVASALAEVGSATVLGMELHQGQGNLRHTWNGWNGLEMANPMFGGGGGMVWLSHRIRWACLNMSPQSTLLMKMDGSFSGRLLVDIVDIVIP